MADPFEAELDRLFQLSPEAMVEARNALATQLRKGGARALADRVKGLKRPTPAAWALNQLHFTQPALLARARACAEQVRALHARDGVEGRALAAAVAAQRQVTSELLSAALERWQTAGLAAGAAQQRKLLATVQGWLAGTGQEEPGRMTRDIEHGGFDAVTAVGAPAPRVPAEVPAPPAPQMETSPEAERTVQSRAAAEARAQAEARARHERRLRAARQRVQELQTSQHRAAKELSRAQEVLRDAEARLAEAHAACRARRETLEAAEEALEAARAEQAAAEQALATVEAGVPHQPRRQPLG